MSEANRRYTVAVSFSVQMLWGAYQPSSTDSHPLPILRVQKSTPSLVSEQPLSLVIHTLVKAHPSPFLPQMSILNEHTF